MEFFVIEVYDTEGNFLGFHKGRHRYTQHVGQAKVYPNETNAKIAVGVNYHDYWSDGSQFVTKIVRYVAVRMEG